MNKRKPQTSKNPKAKKNLKEKESMCSRISIKVETGFAFIATTESRNIEVLRKAAEKYGVDIPDARFIMIYNCDNGMLEYYHELENYCVTEFTFGVEGQGLGIARGSEDKEDIRKRAIALLANNIDNMDWSGILEAYLAEEGICYEEGLEPIHWFIPDSK